MMNYHNCNFSTPNEWMKMPENDNNLLYPPHRRLHHTCGSGPPIYRNIKRKIQPAPPCQKSSPFNCFPGASDNMRHFTPCGWSVHANNTSERFMHCRPNGVPVTRVPHCNVPRFNCPHPYSEYHKYPVSMICKEQESPRNYVKIKMESEEHGIEWNRAKGEPSKDHGYISNNITAKETVSDYELQKDKFMSNLSDDSICYKQCLEEAITHPQETCPENIFSDLIGNDQRDTLNDFSTTERVAEPLHFSTDAEDQKIATLPSELEKAYETMDETALAVYFLNALYPPSSPAVNEVSELSSTKPKTEVNGNVNEVNEQINCWNARDGRKQIKSEPNASVDTSKPSSVESQATYSNAGTVQDVEHLLEECLNKFERKHSASNKNEDNYFEENNQSRHNLSSSGRFNECEIKEEKVHESCCLINSPDPKLNNRLSKQKMTFNNPIKNINQHNRICSIDDSDLCFSESTKILDGINDDKLNSGKLSCLKKCMALRQIGLTEKFKTNAARCNQNSNSSLSTNYTQNVSNTDDFAIPMDITSKLSLRKSQPRETLPEPNANSLKNKKGKKRCASKQTPRLNSTSSTENLSSELNSKSDANILSTHNSMTQSTPNNNGVSLNAGNTEVKEPEFLYSNILDLASSVETSLSSVTNYLLQEPTDSVGNRVCFTVGDYHGSTDSHTTSESPKCSQKQQKAVKRSKHGNMIHVSVTSPQKIHNQQEGIKSSVTLLDNVFESDIDEYLDFDLRRSRKGKIKGKKEERKSNNKSHEKLTSPAMSNPEKLKYEVGDFKSGKLNRDPIKYFNDAVTQTSPMGTANNCSVLKRDAQTQWNISDETFDSTENLKVNQKVCQSQYQFSPNSRNENNVRNKNNSGIRSNYDRENFFKRSPKKSTGKVSKSSVKSDNSCNLTNENFETSKNISTATLKKSNVTAEQNLSLNAKILESVKTSSEIKNLSEEYEDCETTDGPSAGDRNKSRKDIGNLNENVKIEQPENGGNTRESKFREKASNQITNKQIGNGNDTEDEVKDKKCKMILRSTVSRAVKLDNQKKRQINEERKPNLRIRREESSLKKTLKSPSVSQPIAHRLRPRNKGKT